MVVWKPDWKKPIYGQECPAFEWSAKSCDITIWIPDTQTVWYLDESGIQMVTVIGFYKVIETNRGLLWVILFERSLTSFDDSWQDKTTTNW